MDTETINGLHMCQPKNEPIVGKIKNFAVIHMPAKGEKRGWIKIKSEPPEKGGAPYRILSVEPTGWEPDGYGNVSFNLELEASSAFQQARSESGQGRAPKEESTWESEDAEIAAANAVETPVRAQNGDAGVLETRKHLMKSANLLVLCIRATEKAVAPHQPVVAQTSEQFQSDVAKLFIEASSRRTTDGIKWWSYIDLMPDKPL